MNFLKIYFLIINIVTFLIYGVDKWKAKHNAWRISERTLLLTALLGGSIGALVGMYVFHHKTKHAVFRILIPLFVIFHCIVFYWLY